MLCGLVVGVGGDRIALLSYVRLLHRLAILTDPTLLCVWVLLWLPQQCSPPPVWPRLVQMDRKKYTAKCGPVNTLQSEVHVSPIVGLSPK